MHPEDMNKEQLLELLYEICEDYYLYICSNCGTVNHKANICYGCGHDGSRNED